MCSIFDISEYVNPRNGEIRIITSHSCRGFRVCKLGFFGVFFMVIPGNKVFRVAYTNLEEK